ncbi:MAG: Hint domain-containing protein [Rhodospirillales bacterium]|nr:Hint domain-containing protein [Rhodospirillales bacterium]
MTHFGGDDNWVSGNEARTSFSVDGKANWNGGSGAKPAVGTQFTLVLTYSNGATQQLTATVQTASGNGNGSFTWVATDSNLAGITPALTAGNRTVRVSSITYPTGGTTTNFASSTADTFSYITCFVRGTRLATPEGDRRVEDLQPGDRVTTLSGARPVKWIGHRRIQISAYRHRDAAAPIRIRQGAFAEAVPAADLLLSPDHAVFVDGKLICVRQLVNGTTIRPDLSSDSVEYFHVEQDSHDILVSEGLTTESYLDTGNRGFFQNGDQPLTLRPDLTGEADNPDRAAGSCAPFVWDEASVRPIWQALADRARAMGFERSEAPGERDPDLKVMLKGRHIRPLYASDGLHIFALPKGTPEVRLISRSSAPTDACPWLDDRRTLGFNVERIVVRGSESLEEVPLDHPALDQGWWAVERDGSALRRWTNGDAVLPLPPVESVIMLEVRGSAGRLTYLAPPEATDVAA